MAIYFDMDGVLADFRAGIDRLGIPYVPAETTDKAADDAMWDAVRTTPHFYLHLTEIPGGVALFRAMREAGLAPEILSAIPKPFHGIEHAAEDKIAWNEAHLGSGTRTHICFRAEKVQWCHGPEDILIDDQERNVQEWREAGGTGVLFCDGKAIGLPKLPGLSLPGHGGQGE